MTRSGIWASIMAIVCCFYASSQAASIYQQVEVNEPFTATYVVDTGTPPFTWSVTGGQLPPGLQLNSSTGTLSGTFTAAGLYLVQLTATDSSSPHQSTSQLIGFSVQGPPPPPPANAPPVIDAVTSMDSSGASSITSSKFSTNSGDELLLAFISSDGQSSGTTVSSVTGAGLTWALVLRTNTQAGTAEIWRAFAANPLSGVSVTGSFSSSRAASMTVISFSGVDTTGTNGSGAIGAVAGANAASGASSVTLTTTRANSWVVGVGNDWDNAIPRTMPSNQTLVHQNLAAVGDTYWVQRLTNTTGNAASSVRLNDTGPVTDRYNFSAVEVRGPNGTTTAAGNQAAVGINSPAAGQTVSGTLQVAATVSDSANGATVQFTLDGTNLGQAVAGSPYLYSWNTTTVTNGTHTLGAVLTDNAGNAATAQPVSVSVSNTAAPPPPSTGVSVSPTSTNFGNVGVGSSQSQQGTITAQGGSVTVNSASVAGSGYSVSGLTFPLTLTAGQTASFTVTFAPSSVGRSNGSVTFATNATTAPSPMTLIGNGVSAAPPPSHSVALSWNSSTSQVAGYNVYRGSQTGGPYAKINSTLLTNLAYTDANVQSGATYFYVVTAVNSSSQESGYSNQVQAVIPTP